MSEPVVVQYIEDTGYWEVETERRGTDVPSKGYEVAYFASESDARLFIAAPDLLEALKEAFALLEEHEPNWYLRRHYNKFSAAIAKAEYLA